MIDVNGDSFAAALFFLGEYKYEKVEAGRVGVSGADERL